MNTHLAKPAFISLLLPFIQLGLSTKQFPYQDSTLPVKERADDLLQRMTLEERIAQIHHVHSWNIFDG